MHLMTPLTAPPRSLERNNAQKVNFGKETRVFSIFSQTAQKVFYSRQNEDLLRVWRRPVFRLSSPKAWRI